MSRKLWFAMIMVSVLLVGAGCGNDSGPFKPENPQGDLPVEIEDWIENSLEMFLGQSYTLGGKLYLLVTYGEKPTGGYGVEITGVTENSNRLVVTVHFTEPAEGEMVNQALSYPYDLAVIDDPGLPVEFAGDGAESYVPSLYGLASLPPVKAGSQWIKIFSPAPDENVPRKFSVTGVANVFEGTVLYRLSAAGEMVLDEGFTTGAMGDWGYFSFEADAGEELSVGTAMALELYTESPKDGSIQDLVRIELILE